MDRCSGFAAAENGYQGMSMSSMTEPSTDSAPPTSGPSTLSTPSTSSPLPSPQPHSRFAASTRVTTAFSISVGFLSAVVVAVLVDRSTRVLGWVVAAAVFATLLGGVITLLGGVVGHRPAVALTVVGFVGTGGLVLFRAVTEIRRELRILEIAVPKAADTLERSDGFGRALREFGLQSKVNEFIVELPNRIAGGTPAEMARTAGSRGAAFVAGLVLACFICAGGRRSFHGVMLWAPDRKGRMLNRHAIGQALERAHRRTSDLMLLAVAKAVVIGLTVGLLLAIADMPGPTVFGLVFAVASLVPGVGVILTALVSYAIVVGITSGLDRFVALAAVTGAVVIDQVLLRKFRRRGVLDVGPAVGFASFVAGFEFGGIGTALCMLAIVAFLGALWSEYRGLRHHWRPSDEPTLATQSEPTRPSTRSGAPTARLYVVTLVAALATLGTLATANALRQTLSLALIAMVIALALERVVMPLAGFLRGRRWLAVVMICGLILTFFAGLSAFLVPAVSTKAASFGNELPQMTSRLQDVPIFGDALRKLDAAVKVEAWLDQLPETIGKQSSQITDALGGAVDIALAVSTVIILALAFVIDGPRLNGSLRTVLAPKKRRTYDQTTRLVVDIVGRYFAGSLLIAVAAGLVSLSVGLALGVVLAPLAAIWIATTNLIPQIGGFLGGVVFVALGFATSTTAGLACLAYFLTYQQFENHVVQPAVIGRAVSMSPAATMVIALVGGSALGVPGAMISVPIVGAAKLVARHLAGKDSTSPEV